MGGAYRVPGNTTPDHRVEHPLRPGGGEDRVPCLGRGWRGRPVDPAPARARARRDRAGPDPARAHVRARPACRQHPGRLDRAGPRRGADAAARSVASNPIVRFVADALRFYMEFHSRYDGFYGAFIHDPLAVAAALDRTPRHDRGADRRRRAGAATLTAGDDGHRLAPRAWGRPPNVDVAVEGRRRRRSSTDSSNASVGWRRAARTWHASAGAGPRDMRQRPWDEEDVDEPELAADLRGGADRRLRRAGPGRLPGRGDRRRRPARHHRPPLARPSRRPRPDASWPSRSRSTSPSARSSIALRLPIYLDSIGTVLVGVLAGPWAGALTGLLSNLIWSILPIPGGAEPDDRVLRAGRRRDRPDGRVLGEPGRVPAAHRRRACGRFPVARRRDRAAAIIVLLIVQQTIGLDRSTSTTRTRRTRFVILGLLIVVDRRRRSPG